MKKALLVTHVSGFVPQFEMNNVRILQSMGYEVHYASNFDYPSYGDDNSRLEGTGIICHQVDFVRSPYSLKNFTVYCQMKKLMESEQFDLIHCHTPMGGVIARLAAHRTKTGPVIYTAHGLHFYKGAPLKNWMFYYPMEWWLSRYTDQMILINQEDYKIVRRKFRAKSVDYIPGVGVDCMAFRQVQVNREEKRRELGIPDEKIVLLSVGELIPRKNHEVVLRALAELKKTADSEEKTEVGASSFIYVVCGHGELECTLKKLAEEFGIADQVIFAGYRNDIAQICKASDIFVFPSLQEGLPIALLEAMSCGMPVVCTAIRGNLDLIVPEKGGIFVETKEIKGYCDAIQKLSENRMLRLSMGRFNENHAEQFDRSHVIMAMKEIYHRYAKQ